LKFHINITTVRSADEYRDLFRNKMADLKTMFICFGLATFQ